MPLGKGAKKSRLDQRFAVPLTPGPSPRWGEGKVDK
jgi:hypothetical protein